jgi:hypothetical protein
MPRCPNGSRRNKKTGNCESVSNSTKKTTKRCSKGTRRNKKTGNCESTKKSVKSHSNKTKKWSIYKIDYVVPTIATDDYNDYSSYKGIMNIESVYIENGENIAQLIFGNNVEIVPGKKGGIWEDEAVKLNKINKNKPIFQNFITAGLNTDVSKITFNGSENDDDNNYTTKENINEIKNGVFGKYIKIHASGVENVEILNKKGKEEVLREINKIFRDM